jgi:hypothetical protein
MPPLPTDLQRETTPTYLASLSTWTRRRCPARSTLAPGFPAGGAPPSLRFDRLRGFSRIEEFEEHLATVLNSGLCVYFDGAEALLLFGRAPLGSVGDLRIEIGPGAQAPSRFHVLGPGVDASFAQADGSFLAGASDRRRIDLVRYWYQQARPHLLRVWNATRMPRRPVGPIDAA